MDKKDGSSDSAGFNRRAFLGRVAVAGGVAWATPVVTTIGLSRATATPCPAGVAASSSGADAAAADGQDVPDLSAQLTARSERTHSPCYQKCMERRAAAEVEAHNAFEGSLNQAGSDDARIAASAEAYRLQLAEVLRKFQGCIGRCT